MTTTTARPGGFHPGELAFQERAGVRREAARLSRMLDPVDLEPGSAAALTPLTVAVLSARDGRGRLWVSAVAGPPGFLRLDAPDRLLVAAAPGLEDALHGLIPDQPIGIVALDLARRRRVRLNGTLVAAHPDALEVRLDQLYGNCPQFITRRTTAPVDRPEPDGVAAASDAAAPTTLTEERRATIRAADTFFLGTAHPVGGNDASHRGGPPGFVRVDGDTVWWPDYRGNNMFNSLGNLEAEPSAGLLVLDPAGRGLQLSGHAVVVEVTPGTPGDDDATGRLVRFTVEEARDVRLPFRTLSSEPAPHLPPLTDAPVRRPLEAP